MQVGVLILLNIPRQGVPVRMREKKETQATSASDKPAKARATHARQRQFMSRMLLLHCCCNSQKQSIQHPCVQSCNGPKPNTQNHTELNRNVRQSSTRARWHMMDTGMRCSDGCLLNTAAHSHGHRQSSDAVSNNTLLHRGLFAVTIVQGFHYA